MFPISDSFEFDYFGSDIRYGRGAVADLGAFLEEQGFERAMLVTGRNVGANAGVMDPVRTGLGERLVRVFDETTPEKDAETVYDGIEAMHEAEADVLVGVGSGSSLDTARQISAFDADGRPLSAYREAARAGDLAGPDPGEDPTPVVVVPVTLAGADVSGTGAMRILTAEESPGGETVRTYGEVMPTGLFYDPNLFETPPQGVLSGSAMNGFDKAIETPYAVNGSPITDGTAVHALRLFRDSLPRLAEDDPDAYERAVVGIILAQFQRRISIIHAFGHGASRHFSVHQGVIHGVLAPHVLRYLFEQVDGSRDLLAEGLGVAEAGQSPDERAEAVARAVEEVRDGLGLPSRLRDVGDISEADLRDIAEHTLHDEKMEQVPTGLEPTVEDLEGVLRAAW
ncbi:MAG: iron-containing alcohol dehydrogenase family protein [Haloferacaceae archaeon]